MQSILLGLSCLFLVASTILSMTVGASSDPIYNIVYIHVPAAVTSLLCFAVLFVCSVQYIRTRDTRWDRTALAGAEVGLLFATVLNVTGSIWAHAAWGVWWTPTLRLISSAMLWFLYVAYLILRASLANEARKELISAVFAVIAFIDVPLVYISARYVRDIHRPNVTFESPWQTVALLTAVCGTILLAVVLIRMKTQILHAYTELTKH